jgi:hypothetical protein
MPKVAQKKVAKKAEPVKVSPEAFFGELSDKFQALFDSLMDDFKKAPTNKSASKRTRLTTNDLTKLCKEYRAAGVEFDKER